jgi:hypothetical protein
MKKLLALFFILSALSSLAQNILFDTASFVQGGYLFKAPQDYTFDWNEVRYMPYQDKKTANPGFPYFYTNSGTVNLPTQSNEISLDGILYATESHSNFSKIRDSIVTPVIQNLNSIHVTSYREESTTNAGLYISGAQGKTTLLGNFYADHLTSKGQRQHKFIISSYASLANLNFGKNDTVTFVDYTWDTISFFAQTNRKDLGKPALPWRNLYAQHVYSNGVELTNGLRYSDTISKIATRYWSTTHFATESYVSGNFMLMHNPVGTGMFVLNGRDAFIGDSTLSIANWDETRLGGGHFEGGLRVDRNMSIGGTLGVSGKTTLGDTTVLNKIYLSPTSGGLEFVSNYNIGTKSTNYGNTPNFTFIRYNGTFAAKSKIVAGNLILNIAARGYDGTVETFSRAAMQFYAPTDWSTTSHQSGIMLFTTDTIAQRERMRINEKGFVGIGTSAPTANLSVAGNSSPAVLITNTGGVGGAAFQMNDIAGMSNWYFKATSAGFKIRDNTNLMDVITIEKNSLANSIYIKAGGNIGIGISIPTAKLDINSDLVRLRTAKTPASATADGNTGDICWDASYIYVCTATNTWKRSAISNW